MLHRMFNVVQPGSCIRPHQHKKANNSESIIVVQGDICFIMHNKTGETKMFKNYLHIVKALELITSLI